MTTELVINGYKLLVEPVSPLAPKAIEIQYRKKNPAPERPTYEVEAAGGVVETFEHTHESVETTEEKEALLAWQDANEEWQAGLTYKLLRLFLSQGIALKLTKKQKENIESQLVALELDTPENEKERDLFYLETFIINSTDAMQDVIEAVLAETGVKGEALDAANATFPS